MIVDDLEFRDSFYWKNLIEEKIRVILYFFYFVQNDVCQNMYFVGFNYCEKFENFWKVEREMEMFLFGFDVNFKMEIKEIDILDGYFKLNDINKCLNKVLKLNDRDIIYQKFQDFQKVYVLLVYYMKNNFCCFCYKLYYFWILIYVICYCSMMRY